MSQPAPQISVTCEAGAEYAAPLEEQIRRAWTLIEEPPRTISLVIVDAARMSELHREFLGRSGPTDVLSFELEHEEGRVVEGEIIMCLDVAAEEAASRGIPVEHELLLYALHGLLHLSGYDDKDAASSEAMHRREDEILQTLGIGPIFGRSPSDGHE